MVFVALNRGYSKPRKKGDKGIREPEFYILPISYVLQVRDPNNEWGKIVKNRLVEIENYQNRWDLIRNYLEK